ncbi:MAG: ATPase, partial [Chlorobiaceae bacterium]|nr:ATPase [Chlorobiaceae bacterium]
MAEGKKNLTIVVAGDITVDCNIAHDSMDFTSPTEWTGKSRCSINYQYGSAGLLAKLIETILEIENKKRGVSGTLLNPEVLNVDIDLKNPLGIAYSYSVWMRYQDKADEQSVWRIKEFLGVDKGDGLKGDIDKYLIECEDKCRADIIVIDDSDLGFRDDQFRWEKIFDQFICEDDKPWIVVKMSPKVARGRLWGHLITKYSDKLVVVLNVDDLRQSEIQVSARISWEKTAQELLWELENNAEVDGLMNSAYCVISFGTAGALMISNNDQGRNESKLFFDKLCMEGEWLTGKGMMIGSTSTLVAGIIKELISDIDKPDIDKGIQVGVAAMRQLYKNGYKSGDKPDVPMLGFPFDSVVSAFKGQIDNLSVTKVVKFDKINKLSDSYWTILQDSSKNNLICLCSDIVKSGYKKALINVPVGEFGKLVTVDRREIES